MENQDPLPRLVFSIIPEQQALFTTVLQSGIEIKTASGTTIGSFLSGFKGFTAEYLANTVQTIFQNGAAVDDLTTLLSGENPILALSAAMPGLAGAIFRRNSFHAALRSDTKQSKNKSAEKHPITVTLKLFNSIALERGIEILQSGVCLKAAVLASFLAKRPSLYQYITGIRLNETDIDKMRVAEILEQYQQIYLTISPCK